MTRRPDLMLIAGHSLLWTGAALLIGASLLILAGCATGLPPKQPHPMDWGGLLDDVAADAQRARQAQPAP